MSDDKPRDLVQDAHDRHQREVLSNQGHAVADKPTEQQRAIETAAFNLVDLLEEVVPSSTVHYAVEDAKRAVRTLHRLAATIKTEDVK